MKWSRTKEDSTKVEAVADAVLSKYDTPDDVNEADLRHALLSQLVQIAKPKSQEINAQSLEPEGIDADRSGLGNSRDFGLYDGLAISLGDRFLQEVGLLRVSFKAASI
jgi:hypothetical protein